MIPIPKHLRVFWLKKPGYFFKTELQQLPKHSEFCQFKYLNLTLNSINLFLLLLVISFLRSQFKTLRMSWYKIMKPFRDILELVINKYFCSFNDSFPGVDSYSNDQVFSGISNYFSSYNYISILFELFIYIFLK